jgi:o-succinylbenzoate---CoA ligase
MGFNQDLLMMEKLLLNGEPIDRTTIYQVEDDAIREFLAQWWDDTDELTVTTSGSTGTPKSIRIRKSAMIASAQMTITFFQLKPGIDALLCLPAHYIAGRMMIVRAIVGAWNLRSVLPDSNPLLHLEKNERFDFCAMVPLQVSNALQNEDSKIRINRINTLIIGGGEIPPTLYFHLQNIRTECWSTYGMTETVSHVALRKINGPDKSEDFKLLQGVKGLQDERGCLIIEAPHLHSEQLITNDLVEFTDFNRFKWRGRIDHVVNSGGIKIHPEPLEQKIGEIITDRRFFLTGMPDDRLGQKLVIVLEGKPLDLMTEQLLMQHLRESLPRHQSPSVIQYQQEFEETPTGKVIRKIN